MEHCVAKLLMHCTGTVFLFGIQVEVSSIQVILAWHFKCMEKHLTDICLV